MTRKKPSKPAYYISHDAGTKLYDFWIGKPHMEPLRGKVVFWPTKTTRWLGQVPRELIRLLNRKQGLPGRGQCLEIKETT